MKINLINKRRGIHPSSLANRSKYNKYSTWLREQAFISTLSRTKLEKREAKNALLTKNS